MSVQNLLGTQPRAEYRRSSAGSARTAGASFQEQLAAASTVIQGPPCHLRMPNENTVFSGCRGNTAQEIYAEYTADSTPEDPIVHVSGRADSGPYSFTCHIRDIDPSNASYAELAALYGHLVKTGAFQSALGSGVLPTGLEAGDITEKRDYLSMIDRHQYDPHFGSTCKAQAAELLALYQPSGSGTPRSAAALDYSGFMKKDLLSALAGFQASVLDRMKKAKENEEEEQAWQKLMKCLDAWIETIREDGGNPEKSARAYAALQAELSESEPEWKTPSSYLLEQLTECLGG